VSSVLTDHEIRRVVSATIEEMRAKYPTPTSVTLKQAAEMLGISVPTARKIGLPRGASGLIPYEAVLAARDSR
jgi:hypothetical protein